METFRITGDDKHLYFKNLEKRSGQEEFRQVMDVLTRNECQIINRITGPDCTLFQCRLANYRFAVCDASVDGEGTILCVDDEQTMVFLEDLFNGV